MHKLSKILVITGLMIPLGTSALGTGEMKLYSSLNQKLNAEVPLVTGGDESLDGLTVSLAPAAAFARIGVDRPYFLNGLRFDVVSKGRSIPTIKITSSEPITEPFVRFLVDMHWPQGHVVRDFTLLLDPPTGQNANNNNHAFHVASASDSSLSLGVHANPASFVGAEYGPVGAGDTLWSIAKLVNRDQDVSIEQMMAALYEANPQSFDNANVSTIIPGSTLSVPDRTTALRRDKAEAKKFIEEHAGNKHAKPVEKVASAAPSLPGKKTKTPAAATPPENKPLTLLTPDQVSHSSPDKSGNAANKDELALEIAYTIKQENEDIRGRLAGLENQLRLMQRLLTLKDEQLAALQAGKPMPSLPADMETLAKSPLATAGAAAQPAAAPVAAVKPTPPAMALTSPPSMPLVSDINSKPADSQPAAIAPTAPVEAKPVAAVTPAVPVEAKPVAAITPAVPAEAKPVAAVTPPAAPPATTTSAAASDTGKPADTAASSGTSPAVASEPAKPLEAASPSTSATPPVQPAPAAATAPAAVSAPPTPAVVKAPPPAVVAKPPLPQAPAADAGWLADPALLGILGGVGLLIAGLAMLAVKRRRAALAKLDDGLSLQEVRPVNLAPTPEVRTPESGDAGLTEPSRQGSLLSDFNPSDFDVLDGDNQAVDPISEVDVYLAYNRYNQAEELIRRAISENPFRDECKLKLLEIFYIAQNREAFEQYANELLAENKNNDRDFWARVVDMGSSLLPENPMFSRGSESVTAAAPTSDRDFTQSAIIDMGDMDFSFDIELDEPLPQADSAAAGPAAEPPSETLDFEIDAVVEQPILDIPVSADDAADALEDISLITTADIEPETPPQPLAEQDPHSLDFDLGSFTVAAPEPESKPEITATANDDELALEFDVAALNEGGFRFAGVVQSADEPEPALIEEQGRTLAFDLTSISSVAEKPPAPSAAETEEAVDFDLSDFAIDTPTPPPTGAAAKSNDEFDFDMSFDLSNQPPDTDSADDAGLEVLPNDVDIEQIDSKLDLARAFIDMENPAAARQMLEEVLEQGDSRQKTEALELLNSLA